MIILKIIATIGCAIWYYSYFPPIATFYKRAADLLIDLDISFESKMELMDMISYRTPWHYNVCFLACVAVAIWWMMK